MTKESYNFGVDTEARLYTETSGMTEKRFTIDKKGGVFYLFDNRNLISIYDGQPICDLLNILADENEQLKIQLQEKYQDLTELGLKYGDIIDIKIANEVIENQRKHIKEVEKENEQLKQINRNLGDFRNFITEQNALSEKQRKELQLQMLRLYNYFENYFEDEMSPNAFSEMWDSVKEDAKWEKR